MDLVFGVLHQANATLGGAHPSFDLKVRLFGLLLPKAPNKLGVVFAVASVVQAQPVVAFGGVVVDSYDATRRNKKARAIS